MVMRRHARPPMLHCGEARAQPPARARAAVACYVPDMSTSSLHTQDFNAWAEQQAALLRAGDLAHADIAGIAEEIESMGRSEKRELVNRLAVLLLHLLKWQAQPMLRGHSWRLSVKEQRLRLAAHLADNSSLKPRLPAAIAEAHRLALVAAERETGLPEPAFPPVCPWSAEQMLDEAFWPAPG